ncbi:MAG TPA: cytochrome P450 [Myxococcota bacterium]|jgi:cytochrome P450
MQIPNLLDAANFAAGPPHDVFRTLRREAPVYWHPHGAGGFFAITKHADVVAVSRDSGLFSSALKGYTPTPEADPVGIAQSRLMLLGMDPPQHTRLRGLVNKGFTPRRVTRLEPRIRALCKQIVDAVLPRGECDFVTDVAGELPSYLIAELVGIPLEDGRKLYELTEVMHSADNAGGATQAVGEMFAYSARVRAAKRAHPGEDLASVLLGAELDGSRLSDLEFDLFFLLLINAGGDTTRNLVAAGTQALMDHPEQLAALRKDRALLESAIEEMLRFTTPVVQFQRTATRDTELRGVKIREGQSVVVFYPSANRDEEVFAKPDAFDIRRDPNPHVAFGGGGSHFCLGASLARLEIRCMFEELLDRVHDLAPNGPVERLHSWFISGPRRMPVRFRATRV